MFTSTSSSLQLPLALMASPLAMEAVTPSSFTLSLPPHENLLLPSQTAAVPAPVGALAPGDLVLDLILQAVGVEATVGAGFDLETPDVDLRLVLVVARVELLLGALGERILHRRHRIGRHGTAHTRAHGIRVLHVDRQLQP